MTYKISTPGYERWLLWLAVVFSALITSGSFANPPATAPNLVVDPSSSQLAGGSAKLNVDPLSRSGAAYVGAYRIKVFPYFFKSEAGKLSIDVSESQLQQMQNGSSTSFVGRAQATGSEIIHAIKATISPATDNTGKVTFTVTTDSGPLVFNTSYHLVVPGNPKDS